MVLAYHYVSEVNMSRCFTDVIVNVICHARNPWGLIRRNGCSPPAKREWVYYFMLIINLNILVQQTMNAWVTNIAMQLLYGQNKCSSFIHPILSNSPQVRKVSIWMDNEMANQLIPIWKDMLSFYGLIK